MKKTRIKYLFNLVGVKFEPYRYGYGYLGKDKYLSNTNLPIES
jgi:hypothetical protein